VNPQIRNARTAAAQVRQSGPGSCCFYTPNLDQIMSERLKIENGLRTAVQRRTLDLHFQPFRVYSLAESVERALERHGVPPHLLQLEVTEGAYLQDADRAADEMRRLIALGVSFALDDFGTGYSSLSYVKRLPIAYIKIDRSFIRDLASTANDRAIVQAIVAMARALSLETIAEGVEDGELADLLAEIGCDQAQGFHFARPMPEEAYLRFLAERRAPCLPPARGAPLPLPLCP